jgi:sugar lactone lactonase YvrE
MKTLSLPTALLCLVLTGQVFAAKVIPNNPIADLVLGQTDFVTGTAGSPASSFSLDSPSGVVVDPMTRKVFVCEQGNHRILRYPNADSLANGAGAEAVFGQSSFNTTASSDGAGGLNNPRALFLDRKGRLWVADSGNRRILMYEAASYRSDQPSADRVLGQPDFTTTTALTSSSKFKNADSVVVDTQDRMWMADESSNRVLRFDAVSSKPNGAAADGVLGQPDFTSSASGSGSSGMQTPTGVAVSPTGTLYVSVYGQNRILVFNNAASLGNGAGASAVLGQSTFLTTASGTSATTLDQPANIWLTADDSLWVCDYGNSRALRYSMVSVLSNGAAADGVVGQPDFVTNTATTTDRGLKSPFMMPSVDSTGSLWVSDRGNNRVLRFPPDVTRPLLTLTGTVPKTIKKKTVVIKGTASDAYGISKIQYRIGTGALKTASGTTSWQFTASLKKGKNTITIIATDSVGNVSLSKVVRVKRK